ncbi:MAG: chromate transporter [Bacteroidaceae bacterium]|jgi:chromate transporter|nr:chromate transporter [Bacteroidaceae bacterium]SDG69734.1 chromate transporter [Bacteroidales bacterium KHT7]
MGVNTTLFFTFLKIGTTTIGGGYAMIPMMEREIVDKYKWLERGEFMDIMAVSQATPGIFAANMASHIGYKLTGIKGGIIALLGNLLPSIVCILLIVFFFQHFKDNHIVQCIFMGLRPVVVALIASPVFKMMQTAKISWHNAWIPVLSALLIWLLGVSPIYIIIVAAVGGYLYGIYNHKKEVK